MHEKMRAQITDRHRSVPFEDDDVPVMHLFSFNTALRLLDLMSNNMQLVQNED